MQMRHRKSKWPSATAPVTLDMLGGIIESVPSQENYLSQDAPCAGRPPPRALVQPSSVS